MQQRSYGGYHTPRHRVAVENDFLIFAPSLHARAVHPACTRLR